jgi:D-serine deaminase-like pyridoxal phosphate-dependent protein
MERPISKPIGTPEVELDTPAFVVDVEKLDRNIETAASFFRDNTADLRPHVSGHGSPSIAHRQLAAGGTVGGIATATVGQAEVFARYGFGDVFVANVVATPLKARRLSALSRTAKVTVAADSAAGVDVLSQAASAASVTLNVVVYVRTGQNGMGVEPGGPAVELARAVDAADGLAFAGLMTYEGTILCDSRDETEAESLKWAGVMVDTREAVEAADMNVEVLSIGGTHNYETVGAVDGVTEVPAGSYALMDEKYRAHRPQFENAGRVMTCVTSMPEPGNIITDGGRKAIGGDAGNPGIEGVEGAVCRGLSAEHGGIQVPEDLDHGLKLGDRIWCVPMDVAGSVNVHDYLFAIRGGVLEAIWDLPARGHYR